MSRHFLLLICVLDGSRRSLSLFGQDDSYIKKSCDITAQERCPISSMREPTEVFPGGETRCMSMFQPRFSFSVFPGDPEQLLIFLESGGACVDPVTAAVRACDEAVSVNLAAKKGIFDFTQAANPYKNFTVIYINYCSGDLFAADIKQKFGVQFGLINTKAALNWAKENHFDRKLRTFVLAGSSAGSLGAQLWARSLLTSFKYERAAVIADSFVCVMPAGAQGMLFRTYQVCDNGLLSTVDQEWCRAGNLTVQHVYASAIASFPEVTFASVNSKEDSEQIKYYNLLSKVFHGQPPTIDPASFYKLANSDLAVFNKYPNFVSYWVNSNQHMFLNWDSLYGVDATGTGGGGNGPKLIDWLGSLSERTDSVSSQCSGKLLTKTMRGLGQALSQEQQAALAVCSDAAFPFKVLKQVSGLQVAICFSKQNYAAQGFGPCESWCVTDVSAGDGPNCNGCCGDIHSKVCGVESDSAYGTDYCDPSQAGKVWNAGAFLKQNQSMPQPSMKLRGTWSEKIGHHYVLVSVFAFIAICFCCCCTLWFCRKDSEDYPDDVSEKSWASSAREPSLLSTLSHSDEE